MIKKIVSAGMFIMACMCTACSQNNGFVEVSTEALIELHTQDFTDSVHNNAILLKYQEENVVFDCSVDNGYLLGASSITKALSVASNNTIYWEPYNPASSLPASAYERDFIEIIVKNDGNIIGYAVIEIVQKDTHFNYTASISKSVLFPKIEGEYQNITQKQVSDIIEKIKKKGGKS